MNESIDYFSILYFVWDKFLQQHIFVFVVYFLDTQYEHDCFA